MKSKTGLLILLLLCSAVLLLTAHAEAPDGGTCGENLTWTLDDESRLTISGTGEMTNWKNTSSAPPALPWGKNIKSVVIEAGVTSLGDYAFYQCSALQRVSIPPTVTRLGRFAFVDCFNLSEVELSEGLETIENGAFLNCASLEEITLPQSVVSVDSSAFSTDERKPPAMQNIYVKTGNPRYYDIDGVLFEEGGGLVRFPGGRTGSYTVPAGTKSIAEGAFLYGNIQEVIVSEGVTSIGSMAFQHCRRMTEITLPESLVEIGFQGFYNCGARLFVIPKSVKAISDYAFADSKCDTIFFEGRPDSIGVKIFHHRTIQAFYRQDDGWTQEELNNYGGAVTWNEHGEHTPSPIQIENEIPATCSADGSHDEVVYCLVCGKEISREKKAIEKLPHDWRAVEYSWSEDHAAVTAVHVCNFDASHVESETVGAHYEATLSPTETTAGEYAAVSLPFTNSSFTEQRLEGLPIPALGELNTLKLPAALEAIEESAFSGLACQAVIVPDGCTGIGSHAFMNCPSLIYVRIPASAAVIAEDAFEGCGQVIVDRTTE